MRDNKAAFERGSSRNRGRARFGRRTYLKLAGALAPLGAGARMTMRRAAGQERATGDTYLYVEAESAAGRKDFVPFRVVDDDSASSGSYIVVPNSEGEERGGPPNSGHATYEIDVPSDGDYVLWGRSRPESDGNTFYVSIDGSSPDYWEIEFDPGTWLWDEYGTLSLSAGTHTIEVIWRESGADLDRLLLTSDTDYEPSGIGGTSSGGPDSDDGTRSAFAINAGGDGYTADDGTEYRADTNFEGGEAYSAPRSTEIDDTEDDPLYRSERYSDFSYAIDVEDGTYDVTLKFAEIYFEADGKRVFDVSVEGTEVVSNLDIHAQAGSMTALDRTVTVDVTDGELNVDLVPDTQKPKLSAIEVVTSDGSSGDDGSDDSDGEQTPFGESPANATERVEAEFFDGGGQDVAYTDADEKNWGDSSIRESGVDVQPTTDDAGANVGWMQDGEWLEYTVSATAGTYDLDVRVASRNGGNTLTALVDGTEVGSVEVPNTGGWQNWTTITIPDIDVADGEHVVRLEVRTNDRYAYNVGWFRFADSDSDGGSDGGGSGGDDGSDGGSDDGSDSGTATVSGTQELWHRTTLSFDGPDTAESADPNPFVDYRLQVRFEGPSGQVYDVPGYYAGDGNGGSSGPTWKAHLAADEAGEWSYTASFREGDEVAVSTNDSAGSATAFDGASGSFSIGGSSASGRDFRASDRGLLINRGDNYLTFPGGDPWIKGGPNIPENFLAHDFGAQGGRKGAISYVADRGCNCIYFLPNNVRGDGDDTWPHPRKFNAKTRYDNSKLAEWRDIFEHAGSEGVLLHFVLAETEPGNENYYDNGDLGEQRKLFYRELIARFGHVMGIEWNLCEETDYGTRKHRAFADFIHDTDPYDHPVTVHIKNDDYSVYEDLLGNDDIDITSFQTGRSSSGLASTVAEWRSRSASSNTPWPVSVDEGSVEIDDLGDGRREEMWPVYMAGGNYEWYIKNPSNHSLDQNLNDYGRIESALEWTGYALDFMGELPVQAMTYDADGVSGGDGYLFGSDGQQVYAVYLPEGDDAEVSVVDGTYEITWLNPRTGGKQVGTIERTDDGAVPLSPPFDGDAVARLDLV